ncbi:MAG: cob(I)yrinic acid a,c-diamide adenosyltransferase [Chloroflexi bacterium]|nr:cob(I)yrinic acid a,c-diamide adenosyltransferase [Chloroflexota bacterium]
MRSPQPLSKGLVEVYTGDGKGKTTAALGVALRAAGHGLRVHIVFFMKGDSRYGEQEILAKLPGVTFARFGFEEFVNPNQVKEAEKEQAREALVAGREAVLSGDYDVVILDEINVALGWKLLGLDAVLQLVKEKPAKVELILTGRYAPPEIIEVADLVTEMKCIKHPFNKGTLARGGIDY